MDEHRIISEHDDHPRTVQEIKTTGAAVVTEAELSSLCAAVEAAKRLYEINFLEEPMRAVEAKLPLQAMLNRFAWPT